MTAQQPLTLEQVGDLVMSLVRSGDAAAATEVTEQVLSQAPLSPEAFNVAAAMYASIGQKARASSLLAGCIALVPDSPMFLANFGRISSERRQPASAISWHRRVRALRPDDAGAAAELAAVLGNAGALEPAAALYAWIVGRGSATADDFCRLGTTLSLLRQAPEALSSLRRSLALVPHHVDSWKALGDTLLGAGDPSGSIVAFGRSFPFARGDGAVIAVLASIFFRFGRPVDAMAAGRRGLALQPHDVACWMALCHGSSLLGRAEDALAICGRSLAVHPENPDVHHTRGRLLLALGRPGEAVLPLAQALALAGDSVEILRDHGSALLSLGAYRPASASLRRALALDPSQADVWSNLGAASTLEGRRAEARRSYARTVAINPDHAEARWKAVLSAIPILADEGAASGFREVFAGEMRELDRWLRGRPNAHEVVGCCTAFYLAYHEQNNRDLLGLFGTICARLMAEWREEQGVESGRRTGAGPIRVGIASTCIRAHSVWHALVKGWFEHIDRDRIELHTFSLGGRFDAETAWAAERSKTFVRGPKSGREWVEAIARSNLDVLIYPEIGMDPMTVRLASLRLAPVQVATWGHPETTGLPTIDYFLTSEDLEPPEAEKAYVETLVVLPRLGCCYSPPDVRPASPGLAHLGLRRDGPMLLCPGVPFKYTSRFDRVVAEIAKRVGPCEFVFFASPQDPALSAMVEARVRGELRRSGLDDARHIRFIPWQPLDAFYGLMREADVMLDTIGFSGFNTAMQAVECDLPIVAFEGQFLRGRFASAILKRLGLAELVAGDDDAYASIAARLMLDMPYRQDVRRRIHQGKEALFDDVEVVRALERFLETSARG